MSDVSNPYAAPVAPSPKAVASGSNRSSMVRAAQCAGVSLAFGLLAVAGIAAANSAKILGTLGFGAAALSAALGVWFAGRAIVRTLSSPPPRALGLVSSFGLVVVNGAMTLLGAALALMSTSNFSRGRQLRRFGRVLLPQLVPGDGWSHDQARVVVDDAVRDRLAAQWRENAKTEHASVAAFARLTLDLIALGAPSELVAASQRDALDEVRHAEACLSLAAAIDGKHESPAPFPEAQHARTLPRVRHLALATLAVDSLVDGALHEGVSARIIARLARLASVPAIGDALGSIAADEGRHAAHGWHVVEWCVREGGDSVVHALEGAARTLPETMRSSLPPPAEDGSWERWGIHGSALEAEEYAKARDLLMRRVTALGSVHIAA